MEYRRIANITEGHRFLNLSVLDADGLGSTGRTSLHPTSGTGPPSWTGCFGMTWKNRCIGC